MPVTFTTDLPDAEGLDLDGSEPDEITAQWTQVLNNGEYRLEVRESDANEAWGDSGTATVAYDATLEHTFTGILDGEKFDVRIRTQTAHVTGSWLTGEEITNLPAPDGLTISNVGATSLDLSWIDNANFQGSYQILRKRTDYDYDGGDGRLVGTVSDTAESYTDGDAQPAREYEYVVRARTAWVHADTSPQTVTTDSIGLEDRAVPPRGWHAEVDHPSGTALTPEILDGAVRRPTINGYPRVEVPVPYRERWHSDAFDDAAFRVWHDSDCEPVEVLEHRSLEEGSGSKRTVLEGRGGTQLDNRVVEDVDIQPTHEFVRYLLDTYTDYDYTVDDPQVDQESVTLQAADTDVELEQAVAEAVRTALADDTIPLEITSDGRIVPLQTVEIINLTGDYSDDQYVTGSAGDENSVETFDALDYSIPDGEVGVAMRQGVIGSDPSSVDIGFDSTTLLSNYAPASSSSPGWQDLGGEVPSDYSYTAGDSPSFTLTEVSSGADGFPVDLAVLYDRRYHDPSTWDNSVHEAGGHLDSPPLYPEVLPIDLKEITTPLAISELTLEVVMDNGDGAPELALREDGTDSWNTVTDATSHSITYTEQSTTARARVSVGYDDTLSARDTTPRYGYEPQGLDSLVLDATLDSTPVLTNRSFDGNLIDVLREVAKIGNFVFEVQADGDTRSIEWTQLGQREVSIDPEVADYSVDRQTEDVVERAIVYGSAAQITRQTVDVTIGTWVDLPYPDAKIVERKETIYDGDTEFTRGEDYQIRYATKDGQPQIKALSDGALSDGQTVSVDAEVKPRGEHTAGDAGENPKTTIEDIPGLASKQMCDQYALYAVEKTGDAIVDASVTIPEEEVGASLVDAIDIDRLPGDVPWEVDDISYGDGEVSIELGNGPSADDFLQGLSDRLQRNSERV